MNINNHYKKQSEYFDSVASTLGANFDSKPNAIEIDYFLNAVGVSNKDLKILDVGAGTGRYTLNLLKRGYHVTAVDISSKSLSVLSRRAEKHGFEKDLSIRITDMETSVFDKEFDLVFCVNLLHHVDSMDAVFENMVKAVKPGGKIAVLEENPLNISFYPFHIINKAWDVEKGVLKCTRFHLTRLFLKNGVNDIKVDHYLFIPMKFAAHTPFLLRMNRFLGKVPLIREFSLFNLICGSV